MDTLTDVTVERLKEQTVDKIQEKVAQATSHVPLAGEPCAARFEIQDSMMAIGLPRQLTALEKCHENLRLVNLIDRHFENISIDHHEISLLADLDRPSLLF